MRESGGTKSTLDAIVKYYKSKLKTSHQIYLRESKTVNISGIIQQILNETDYN